MVACKIAALLGAWSGGPATGLGLCIVGDLRFQGLRELFPGACRGCTPGAGTNVNQGSCCACWV
jgi:hypothetical protein